MTWKFIKDICDKCDLTNSDLPMDVIIKTRKDSTERKYQKWKSKVGEVNLYEKVFGNSDLDVVLRLNDFPYNFESSIVHYVVWLNPSQTKYPFGPRMDQTLLDRVVSDVRLKQANIKGILHYRNAPDNRTIHSINHYHLLVKIK